MSEHEYNNLLYEISEKIDATKLGKLVFICRYDLPKGCMKDSITTVLTLFEELEKNNRLGIDRLDTLKNILTLLKKGSLLKRVEEFDAKRKAQSCGIISSVKRAAGSIVGAVRLVCNFRTLAGGVLLVGSGLALRSCSSFEEFSDAFNKVVLPAFSKLVELGEGSLSFTVQAEAVSALNELWSMYNDGTLKNRLQEFLVTEEVKQLAGGENVEVTVFIDEQEYKEAYLNLMLLQNQANDLTEQEPPDDRRRRTSDSFLHLSPKEDEVTLMRLKQAENKWNFKVQLLEKEIEELTLAAEAWKIEQHLERPTRSRRRNSDSELYYKGIEQEVRGGEKKEERFLAEEKYAFVQNYLKNLQERQSLTTETSDSGIKTHGAPSELGMEDISDSVHKPCYKDLTEDVTSELSRRIKADSGSERLILQSFGITRGIRAEHSLKTVGDVFRFFPNTPVKLLKDVFEALQLYDLVELLEKPANPFAAGSLRLGLSLDEIQKWRNTAGRPISYHSRAAVLIVAEDTQGFSVKGIETFFKDLNLNSKVTVIQSRVWFEITSKQRNCETLLQHTQDEIEWINEQLKTETEQEAIIALKRGLQSKMETLDRTEKALKDLLKEEGSVLTASLMVINEWIQRQDEFSFFAVFDLSRSMFFYDVISKLGSAIPTKKKFVFGGARKSSISELLQVSDKYPFHMLLKILNKRWQTLDLVSMVQELKRSYVRQPSPFSFDLFIQDALSSLPRFKRAEDLS